MNHPHYAMPEFQIHRFMGKTNHYCFEQLHSIGNWNRFWCQEWGAALRKPKTHDIGLRVGGWWKPEEPAGTPSKASKDGEENVRRDERACKACPGRAARLLPVVMWERERPGGFGVADFQAEC